MHRFLMWLGSDRGYEVVFWLLAIASVLSAAALVIAAVQSMKGGG